MTQHASPIPESLFHEIVNVIAGYLQHIGVAFQMQHAYAPDAQHVEVQVLQVYPERRRRLFEASEERADCWQVSEVGTYSSPS